MEVVKSTAIAAAVAIASWTLAACDNTSAPNGVAIEEETPMSTYRTLPKLIVCATLLATVLTIAPAHGAGGGFTARYRGTYRATECRRPSRNGQFRFSGSGTASFLGAGTEAGFMSANQGSFCNWEGQATLISSSHSADSITVSLSRIAQGSPCTFKALLYQVIGGTGKFAEYATGSGNVYFTCSGSSGAYTDYWTGTLHWKP